MDPQEVPDTPKDRTFTFGSIVVDYREKTVDPNRFCITAGGNFINYPGELTTKTADLTTSKILWNIVLSIDGALFMCINIKNFYPCAPMYRYYYMRMTLKVFPQNIIDQYNLNEKERNGFIYFEIRRSVYSLP